MKIKKVWYDKDRGTDYYNVEDISNWDLERLYRLLETEMSRSIICEDGYRGSMDLLVELRKLAKERQWKIT